MLSVPLSRAVRRGKVEAVDLHFSFEKFPLTASVSRRFFCFGFVSVNEGAVAKW
jgi:hypothetical protein